LQKQSSFYLVANARLGLPLWQAVLPRVCNANPLQNRLTFADHFDPLEQMLERFLLYIENSQKIAFF